MENLNPGYVIMAIMIVIPILGLLMISKEDVKKYKNKKHI